MFESAGRASLTYHVSPDWTYDTNYYSIDITPDGFNSEEVINEHGDVFSTGVEFSKIHKFGKGDFWEKFAVKEVKDFAKVLGKAGEVAKQIIDTNIFGKNHKDNRYFFFPYTQFQQDTLKDIQVDIIVSSYGKSELPDTLSDSVLSKKVGTAFTKRLALEFSPKIVKYIVFQYFSLTKLVATITAIEENIELIEDGVELATGGDVKIDTSEALKKMVLENKRIQAAVSDIEESIQYIDAKSREMDEVSDRNSILAKKQKEKQEKIKEMAAEIDTTEEIIEDTGPIIEHFGEIKDVVEEVVEEEIEIEEIIEAEEEIIEEVGGPDTLKLDENIEKAKEELPEQEPVQEIVYQSGSVVINEFMANPNSGESEWIEIYNTTGQSINLSDWSIEDNTGKEKGLGKIILAPYGFVVLEHGKEINFFLNNSGDIIKLKYKDKLIDEVVYGDFDDGSINDNAPVPDKGKSLARASNSQDTNNDQNDWSITETPTYGLSNKISVPIVVEQTPTALTQIFYGGTAEPGYQAYTSSDILINEIMYNVSGSDPSHEWIEIYNPGSSEVDLNGWKFYEAETNHGLALEQGSWTLAAGTYAVISDVSDQFLIDYPSFSGTLFDSSFSLNNSSETIAIKDGQSNIIDQITYLSEWGGGGGGNSIERKNNGTWEQSSSEGGTPGQENSEQTYSASGEQESEDTIAPDITGLSDDRMASKSKTWDWASSDATAQFRYVIDQSLAGVPTGEYGDIKTASQSIGNGTYYLHVQAKDSASNESEVMTVSAVLDNTSPTIILSEKPSDPTNQTTTDMTVSGDEVISYKYKLDDGEYGNETVVATHVTLSGLSDAEHIIYIIGKDAAGNWQEQANATTYTWIIDTTGPSSSITDPGDTFNESSWPVTIAGTTSSDTNQVEIQIQKGTGTYYLDSELVWQENNSSLWISNGVNLNTNDNTWFYSLPVAKLDQDNNYFFRSRAKDVLGNIQSSLAEIDFIFDKTSPGKVINLDVQEQATPLDLRLSWNEINDNFSGINYYEIDWGSEIVIATNQLYNLTGTNRTTYPFKVRAVDEAGNVGEWSNIKSHSIAIESLVISEVQISGNKEFVELYNPTNDNISLDDWYFAYYSSTQDWEETPHRLKRFPDGAIIQSQGYYLIGVYNVSEFQADWQVKTNENQPYSSGQLSNTNGSIVIYSSSPNSKSSETLQTEYIDAVAWGDVSYVKEGDNSASVPAENQSLERNADQDTDNNANDFSVQASPSPQSVYGLWLNGWDKRKILVVNNKENANDLTNYQVKIDVTYNADMESDFRDIRFTSSNGQTILSYYREEDYTENESAIFWVKIPSISAYSEVIIFQYYNNSTATYDGDGEDVFEFFDDFSTIRGDDYDLFNANWSIPGYVRFYYTGASTDYGYISPKNIEMENLYVKASMQLSSAGASKARQASIDYRRSDSDNYWRFGIDNQITNNSYRGVRFDKSVSTNDGTAVNILGHDTGLSNSFDEWSTYEAWAYETNHRVDIDNDSFSMDAWNLTSHYLDQTGRIYIRGGDIDSGTYVWVDYLMIAKYTLPEPTILTDKSEGYTVAAVQARDSYADFLNWGNRKTITITNVTNTTSTDPLVDYPVKIEMNYLTGMNTDFSDVRFTNPDEPGTALKYWNESYIASTSAVFWAKVPSIPANGTKTIYIYYNNPSATYIGNGEDVFTLFDDFETYRHSEYDQFNAAWQSKEGYVKFYSTGIATNYGYLNPKDLQMKDLYIKARMKLTTAAPREANQAFVDYRYQDTDNYWRFGLDQKGSYNYRGVNLRSNEEGTPFLQAYYLEQFWDEWDTYEIWAADNNHKSRFVDANGDEIVNWEKTTNTLNQTGDIYLRGGELESTGVYTLLDYLIIAQYKEPELTVSISN